MISTLLRLLAIIILVIPVSHLCNRVSLPMVSVSGSNATATTTGQSEEEEASERSGESIDHQQRRRFCSVVTRPHSVSEDGTPSLCRGLNRLRRAEIVNRNGYGGPLVN